MSKRNLSKCPRSYSTKKNMPAGIIELEQLRKENQKNQEYINTNITNIISNIDILKLSYNNIKNSQGNNTLYNPEVNEKTIDIFFPENILGDIENILGDKLTDKWFTIIQKELRTGSFKFKSSTRNLSIRDKIIQEAMRLVLEAIYEPTFLEYNQGFRPEKDSHTVINEIKMKMGEKK